MDRVQWLAPPSPSRRWADMACCPRLGMEVIEERRRKKATCCMSVTQASGTGEGSWRTCPVDWRTGWLLIQDTSVAEVEAGVVDHKCSGAS